MRDDNSRPVRIHAHLVSAVTQNIDEIFNRGRHADKVIEGALRSHPRWGARDRRFVAEMTYEIVRHWRRVCYLAYPHRDERFSGEGGSYGANKTEIQAIVDLSLVEFGWLPQGANSLAGSPTYPTAAVANSFPDWLDQRGSQIWKGDWKRVCEALNQTARVCLRANLIKTDRETLAKRFLEESQIATLPIAEVQDGLVLEKRTNVFATDLFKQGMFEVQDGSSQRVVELLNPQPGEKVIDACAGAGGKTLHLASRMNNRGRIWALDVVPKKLEELALRARRAGASNIEAREITSTKVIKRLDGVADALLLDVPCSGIGVLRRNPDTKWKLTPEDIVKLRELQSYILQNYTRMLRTGGRLVYATCSLLPEENEIQIQEFMKSNPGWKLEHEKTLRPDLDGYDGFYMALLRKN